MRVLRAQVPPWVCEHRLASAEARVYHTSGTSPRTKSTAARFGLGSHPFLWSAIPSAARFLRPRSQAGTNARRPRVRLAWATASEAFSLRKRRFRLTNRSFCVKYHSRRTTTAQLEMVPQTLWIGIQRTHDMSNACIAFGQDSCFFARPLM